MAQQLHHLLCFPLTIYFPKPAGWQWNYIHMAWELGYSRWEKCILGVHFKGGGHHNRLEGNTSQLWLMHAHMVWCAQNESWLNFMDVFRAKHGHVLYKQGFQLASHNQSRIDEDLIENWNSDMQSGEFVVPGETWLVCQAILHPHWATKEWFRSWERDQCCQYCTTQFYIILVSTTACSRRNQTCCILISVAYSFKALFCIFMMIRLYLSVCTAKSTCHVSECVCVSVCVKERQRQRESILFIH